MVLKSGILIFMKCLVTAGPGYEPIDEVRRLTNFSTGELGCLLGDELITLNHDVTLVLGSGSIFRPSRSSVNIVQFTTTDSLKNILLSLKEKHGNYDAIFHSAAICDYRIARIFVPGNNSMTEIKSKKIPTDYGRIFIELEPTEKIISLLRPLFPTAFIVGWKYEVDGNKSTVIEAGERQIKKYNTDACVLNGPAYGKGFGILFKEGTLIHADNKPNLVDTLANILKQFKK